MNPPVEKSSLIRLLSRPHTLCLFAAFVFFVIACACVAQGKGGGTSLASVPQSKSFELKTALETHPPHLLQKARATARPEPAPVRHAGPYPPDITRGGREGMEVAITFDGGAGEAREAGEILDALKDRGIKATLFLTGEFIKENPDIARRIVLEGHEVGNHTMTHPHLTEYARTFTHRTLDGVTPTALRGELEGAASLFREITGREMAPLWRAPYGEVNGEIRQWAWEAGYVHIGWTADYASRESLDTLDWVNDRNSRLYRSSTEIKERILAFGRDGDALRGGIILMHLNTGRTRDRAADVLGEMLDGLTGRGYRFVKVSALMAGNPYLREAQGKRSAQVASAGAGLSHR
ncbi:MAG: polysaccharide deacetylase family protein [Deltaproteobacteria bacterium]|nr:polysaccharide deacetylase family protein [Deltaproteobacteria bacterium]